MDPLYLILVDQFKTEQAIAKYFGLERAVHFKNKVPERIALLCHLSRDIPYVFDAARYKCNARHLNLNLSKTYKSKGIEHDQSTRNHRAS